MKKIVVVFVVLIMLVSIFTACNKVDFKIDFVVDGEIISTVDTNGKEEIKIPNDPEKDGYEFDGWFWDNETFNKPFTANSLEDTPIQSDMTVYAKWIPVEGTPEELISLQNYWQENKQAFFEVWEDIGFEEEDLEITDGFEDMGVKAIIWDEDIPIAIEFENEEDAESNLISMNETYSEEGFSFSITKQANIIANDFLSFSYILTEGAELIEDAYYSGDGEEQDVYILGIDEPIETFTGKIIAVIHRFDDVESKWVVAPINKKFDEQQIEKEIHFQEQFHDIAIIV